MSYLVPIKNQNKMTWQHEKTGHCRYFLVSLVMFSALIFISCGRLSKKTANEIFMKENPTYTIVLSETGEGWEGVAYHHFLYKKPNEDKVYKEIWCFVQQENGTWKVTNREVVKE